MRNAGWLDTLVPHAARLVEARLPDLIRQDPARHRDFSMRVGPLHANFSRQRLDLPAWQALQLAAELWNAPRHSLRSCPRRDSVKSPPQNAIR